MIRKPRRPARNRRALDPSNVPAGPFLPVSVSANIETLLLEFAAPVILNGTPPITVNGASPISASRIAPNIVALSYPVVLQSGNVWIIPERMQQIRTIHGGYVSAGSGTLA